MLTVTVRDFLQGKLDHVEMQGIYLFRAGDDVLYVGCSVDLIERIYAHLKGVSSGIGDLVYNNMPASKDWLVDLMEVEECSPVVQQFYPLNAVVASDIEAVERCMIMHHRPCMNTANNPNGKPLPPHIRRYKDELEVGQTDDLY